MISKTIAHPALVSEGDFIAAQAINGIATSADGVSRRYVLVGLVSCRVCGGGWTRTGSTAGRVTAAATAATAPNPPQQITQTLYLRQDRIFAGIAANIKDSEPHELFDLADSLRAQGITILCDADACVLVSTSVTGEPQLWLIN